MAVGTQQAESPGRSATGASQRGDTIGEFWQGDFQATEFFRLEHPVHTYAF
ncbi:hypothetical protein D3C76_1201190 [compost metagenome]